jgi:ABC-type phosphate transport system substrate-binding protein
MKFLIALFLFTLMYSQDIVIIVNKENPIKFMKPKMIKRIFLGKSKRWPFGAKITPIDHHPKSDIRKEFSSLILEMRVKKVLTYWIKEMIRGNRKPPKMTKEPQFVMSFVKNNIGAIAYIRKSEINDDFKVIRLGDK